MKKSNVIGSFPTAKAPFGDAVFSEDFLFYGVDWLIYSSGFFHLGPLDTNSRVLWILSIAPKIVYPADLPCVLRKTL
jgi:hypothetical protein